MLLPILSYLSILTLSTISVARAELHGHSRLASHHRRNTTYGPYPFLRGVNVGSWLVLEQWMAGDIFNGTNTTDQWSFDQTPGAATKLKQHWETWFTEQDVADLASYGINALRIPIGFWAYDNSNTTYLKGADEYLSRAITWSRNHGLQVWIDLHGAPGSQNGFDNSGHVGAVEWQQPQNLLQTRNILKQIARKYGTWEYADVVAGIEMVNEPISWGANNFNVTKAWALDAYQDIRNATENRNLRIVMQDAFMGSVNWVDASQKLNAGRPLQSAPFAVDSHQYQIFNAPDQNVSQAVHIQRACAWANDTGAGQSAGLPVYVGEWSGATNICLDGNGTTWGATSCNTTGCQCEANAPLEQWSAKLVEQVRRYVEAQMDVWERHTSGYFYWSYKAPGAWGFKTGIEMGFIPNPVTSRMYAPQCGGGYGGVTSGGVVRRRL